MSGKARPRRQCPTCRKLVAVHLDGRLWDHMYPGFTFWDPGLGRSCPGEGSER